MYNTMDYKGHHLTKIRQQFSKNSLSDVKGKTASGLMILGPAIKPGASIAIAVGSRGIKNLTDVVREVAHFIKGRKAFPFIVPAMGSHGDANASEQTAILAGYGISEKTMGIPVRSSMEVEELNQGDSPCPVYMDKNAWESDGVILINRIKPHTDYHSTYESGLVKMAVIGLGKEKQASAIHSYGIYGLSDVLPAAAREILLAGKIIGGVALVENGYDETMLVKVLKSDEFLGKEPGLLELARLNMPSLPADEIDVLVIDNMGKEISGVGIDPNIIGRIRIRGQKEPEKPSIKAIMISDLTEASHGNAIGIGLSDVITRQLYDKIDFSATYVNGITSSFLERVKVPLVAANDRKAYEIALRSCGHIPEGEEKIIRISDTLHLDEMYVSDKVLNLIRSDTALEILHEDAELFDANGKLAAF
jgi:hypothetical protein